MWRILFRAIPTPLWLSCRHGVTYSNARTPSLSDSFPGLLALVTGGVPVLDGPFYHVSIDPTNFHPTNNNCASSPGHPQVVVGSHQFFTPAHRQLIADEPTKP